MADKSPDAAPFGLVTAFQESLAEVGGDPDGVEPGADVEAEPSDPPVESEEEESQFTDKDPEELPESAQKLHKQLQADYTRKMQALSKDRKALEAKKARIEAWGPAMDRYDQDPAVRAKVNAAFAEVDAAAKEAGASTPDAFEKFLEQYDKPSQDLLRALKGHLAEQAHGITKAEMDRQKEEIAKVNAQIEATQRSLNEREAAIQQRRFEKSHPDWKASMTPRQQKLFYAELWEDPASDPAEVYESIMSEFDKGATEKADKVVRKFVDRADNKPVRTPGRSARGTEQIDTMFDAFKSSMREIGR